jgi:hypothetical protein
MSVSRAESAGFGVPLTMEEDVDPLTLRSG